MGEKQTKPFQLNFNGLLKVDFQGSHVTSDGGLILVRELDERLGLGELIEEHLSDSRQGVNKKFPLADLLRQSVYSRLAGYEDLNDAVRVSADPTFRLIGSKRNWDRGAALTSTLHGFETEMLASEENLLGLMAVNRELVAQAETAIDSDRVVLDMDSTESPVHYQQEGSAYNGHFESVCYHPLLLFNQHGDCLAAKLRPGNVHSAKDWNELLLPEIERQQAAGKQVTFRGDAAFAKPEIYESSEERGVQYAIRIPANKSLELAIEDILFRPPGRPGRKPLVRYKSFRYQAESWSKPRRIVAKVEHHLGELFPRVGFIVTNMTLPSRSVVRFYNKRGTAEQWIKEGKQATHWTRLSCHRFRANEVRLQLSVLAYNLGNLWRRLGRPHRIKSWSLTSLHQRFRAGPARWPEQDVGDLPLQLLVGRDANDVVHSAILQRLVDLRLGEGGVGAERHSLAFSLLALDLGQQQFVPVLGAGHVARSQLRRQTVAVLVEQQQRVIADGLKVAVVGTALLLAVDRAFGRIHVEHDALGFAATLGLRHQLAVHRHQPDQILVAGEHAGLKALQPGGQCSAAIPVLLRADQAKRRIDGYPNGVVEILVARQPRVDRLPQQIDERELLVRTLP